MAAFAKQAGGKEKAAEMMAEWQGMVAEQRTELVRYAQKPWEYATTSRIRGDLLPSNIEVSAAQFAGSGGARIQRRIDPTWTMPYPTLVR